MSTGQPGGAGYSPRRWARSALFTPASIIWSLAASGTQPILHGGTLLHQQRAAEAAFEASAAQYRTTVLAASA